MQRIGLVSDTHGFFNEKLFTFFKDVDEIWHAGDIGNIQTADLISEFKPLKAVYGNIDGQDVRVAYPQHLRFNCEKVDVWITHIGGYPGKYQQYVRPEIYTNPPGLFICGHSHITKVIYDKKLNFLHINPGAAGNKGFHNVCTAVKFEIEGSDIKNLYLWEQSRK